MNYNGVKFFFKSLLFFTIIVISISTYATTKRIRKNLKNIYIRTLCNTIDNSNSMLLENVPNGEDTNLIVNKKNISIRGLNTIYNASLVNYKDHYLMAFRFDSFNRISPYGYFSKIGLVELDKNFEQMDKDYVLLNTNESEDPRLITYDNKLFIVFNSGKEPKYRIREMKIAEIDYDSLETKEIKKLDLKLNKTEKNWSPFIFNESNGEKTVYFEYNIPERSIVHDTPNGLSYKQKGLEKHKNLNWNWGPIRGGTQSIKIDDHYLGFFHSCYDDPITLKKIYVMGAYTFEDKPPFNITRISYHPILFEGIYTSAPKSITNPNLRCIYPAGIATENVDGKTIIHVSCGENDSSVKIISFDKKTLYKNFREIN
jgi:predicted GH43/DUF377 family glycosyl hydrolase